MDSLQLMQQRAAGLRAKLDGLREDERLFQRAAGLKTQQEKDHAAVLALEAGLSAMKKELADLQDQKAQAMQSTVTALAEKMGQVLPYGHAVFIVDDTDGVFLGWELPDRGLVAHGGLSGGQRILFDSALAYALARQDRENVILIEGAELGQEIGLLLESVASKNVEAQIVACTCHEITTVPDGWKLERVSEGGAGNEP